MMAMAVLNVVGILADVVGMGMMVESMLPDQNEDETVVRISVGMTSEEVDDTKGNTPGISLYDIMGRSIGSTSPHKNAILDGSFEDIKVPFDDGVGKKPTEYISLVNGGDDAICIAYIALTQPDGTKKAWYGDIGKTCGADWYHSVSKTGDDDYRPNCIWIDRNHSNKLRFQGFGLHINDFAATKERAAQYSENKDLMCAAPPRFKMYEQMNDKDYIPFFSPPLEYVTTELTDKDPKAVLDKSRWVMPKEGPNIKKSTIDGDPPKMIRKRYQQPHSQFNDQPYFQQSIASSGFAQPSARPTGWPVVGNHTNGTETSNTLHHGRPSIFASRLVISKGKTHSAMELCMSPSSKGPDFVSWEEKKFCDMENKQIWPLCGDSTTSACFDEKAYKIKPAKLKERDLSPESLPPRKSYHKVEHWD